MNLRIIVADDHPVVLAGARAAIKASGIGAVVAEVRNVGELLDALALHPCDVLVTDLTMPDASHPDGLLMLRHIRSRYPTLPILLLSATNNLAILQVAVDTGVLGIYDKGSSLDDLPDAIRAVVRGDRYISPAHVRRAEEAGSAGIASSSIAELSPKEAEVLRLLASGLTISDIAEQLNRQISTISRQKRDAMRKLNLQSDAALFDFLRAAGFS